MTSPFRAPNTTLTRREFEVYMLICTKAKENKDIAKELGITRAGVVKHIQNIMDKMGMGTKDELLVQYWRKELYPNG